MKTAKRNKAAKADFITIINRKAQAEQMKAFKDALARCKASTGKVLVVELNRIEAAALELCAKKHKCSMQEYVLEWTIAGMDNDLNVMECEGLK